MFKSVTKFGAAIALLVSAEAFAAGAAVQLAKPVFKPVEAVKPGAAVKSGAAVKPGAVVTPGSLADAAKAAANDNAANDNKAPAKRADSCTLELATELGKKDTRLSEEVVKTELANGGVSVVGCEAGDGGILDMGPDAREVAFTASHINTTTGADGPTSLSLAKKEVKNIDSPPENEVVPFNKLAEGGPKGCRVFNRDKFGRFAKKQQ